MNIALIIYPMMIEYDGAMCSGRVSIGDQSLLQKGDAKYNDEFVAYQWYAY